MPSLGGKAARSQCVSVWEMGDTVVAIFGKHNLSEPSYDLQRVNAYKDVRT